MDWTNDVEVMDILSQWILNQKDDVGNVLKALHPFNDGSPLFQVFQIYGLFVFRFSEHMKSHTESDSLGLTIADISSHSTVQNMVANMIQNKVDGGMNIE